jgi:soluble lytic murein transglycosylase-like protein
LKLLTFALFLCACAIAAHVPQVLKTNIPRLAFAGFHIPAPCFTLDELIRAASRKHQVDAAFVKSVIAAESGFSPMALSPKGAVGLMQLMPETARQFAVDPTVPEQNIEAGVHYLSWLLRRYARAHRREQLRRAIAAYNAGPGAVARYHGVPPYRETRAYVSRVLRFYKLYLNEVVAG